MSETEPDDWKNKWNAFLGTGRFDSIEQPEEGYRIGDMVTGRDGIIYLVKGIEGGKFILGLDREPKGREKLGDANFIRPTSTVGEELRITGIVPVPESKLLKTRPDKSFPGHKEEQN